MYKGQKSVRGGIQDFLCPFTDMYITQGSNSAWSHKGIMANDVRGLESGVRYPYYAPCDIKCLKVYPDYGQSMWQSTQKVRFASGNIDYATFMIAHDDSQDCYVGQVISQGTQLGNMGTKGNATGVHCHIQIEQGTDLSWYQKATYVYEGRTYPVYGFNNEVDLDDCYFVNDTNIIEGYGGSWKKLEDVPVKEDKYINIPEWIEERNIYKIDTKEQFATIKPKKFGGLTYKIFSRDGEFAEIETIDFGRCYVKVTDSTPITDVPTYEHGNY